MPPIRGPKFGDLQLPLVPDATLVGHFCDDEHIVHRGNPH